MLPSNVVFTSDEDQLSHWREFSHEAEKIGIVFYQHSFFSLVLNKTEWQAKKKRAKVEIWFKPRHFKSIYCCLRPSAKDQGIT